MYTLQGKTQSTHYTLSTLDPCMVPDHTSHMVRIGNYSLVPTRLKQAPTPGRNLGDQRQTDPIVTFSHLILHPSRQSSSWGERFQPSGYTATSAYCAHIPAYDQYVQCFLMGANPSVLNRHRRGLQPWRCRSSTSHFLTFSNYSPPLST
jgi:hypothetical protein